MALSTANGMECRFSLPLLVLLLLLLLLFLLHPCFFFVAGREDTDAMDEVEEDGDTPKRGSRVALAGRRPVEAELKAIFLGRSCVW